MSARLSEALDVEEAGLEGAGLEEDDAFASCQVALRYIFPVAVAGFIKYR